MCCVCSRDNCRSVTGCRNYTDFRYHRLNGSSSHVLTATSHSYGKAKNSTPHRIETPNLIEIKFGTVDYVGEATTSAKFHANPSMGGFSANGKSHKKVILISSTLTHSQCDAGNITFL